MFVFSCIFRFLLDEIVNTWDWAKQEPSSNGHCVLLQNNELDFGWYSADCSEEHNVVCSRIKGMYTLCQMLQGPQHPQSVYCYT